MADEPTLPQATDADAQTSPEDFSPPADPGGAHAKGYSADPKPEPAVPDQDPVPLAPGPEHHPAFRVPERDNQVRPTGRRPTVYTDNDRVIGADR